MSFWHHRPDRLATALVGMHWLMLFLLIGVFAAIELRELYPKGSDPREALKQWHFMLGLAVLFSVVLRVAIRLRAGALPPITPAPPRGQLMLGRAVHGLLYAWLICMPLAGWLLLSAGGKPIPFFGGALPPLIDKNLLWAGQIKAFHQTLGQVGYGLIALHASAALYHHVVRRDNTLQRLLPGRIQR